MTDERHDEDEIEVTPEMIKAGIGSYVDPENDEYFIPLEERIRLIYLAMRRARGSGAGAQV